ncbi:hypothetical protein ACF1AL_15020 [Streptomyces sp. NPDC014801]|uniref:hypothetical protein n=1 Tax=Streptomyces sp. NPDC014801 TaxID=3364916 RepID=UPI00370345C9
MDERRDPPPADESSRPVAVSPLPAPKAAWAAYVSHCRACSVCRDVDQHCDEADRLYQEWQARARRALQELG